MRIAAIDIGTNSIHMIIAQVRPDRSFDIIDAEKDMVRLGAGGLDGRALSPAAVAAGLQTLARFRRLAASHRVDEIIAAATSAVREAENGGDFLAQVERQTGIRPQVISGSEEARLIHMAAAYGTDLGAGTAVVIDIGGGSVEITLGTANDIRLARSLKIGVIRLTERIVQSDPLAPRDGRRMIKFIVRQAGSYLEDIVADGFDRVIGTSGTILSLGAMATGQDAEVQGLRNRRVSARALHRLRDEIVARDLQERLKLPGMDPRRADLAVAGSILLDTLLRRLDADELTLCDLALREGLVLDYIRRNQAQIVKVDRYPDVRRRSVVELAERCAYAAAHAQHVARLAVALFDQTRGVHAMTDREREWLEYGALLHDVGMHISYTRHHKHSYYLIKNGDLRGFDPDEVEIIALLTRYHRRATPKKSHGGYSSLKAPARRAVKGLAAMLRLAESLDRTHAQALTTVDLHDRDEDYLLSLRAVGDAELELWAAQRHVQPLEAFLQKPIRFEITGAAYDEHPHHAARVSGKAVRRRRHRRIRQDDAAQPAREVADRGRPSRVRDRVELVGAGEGGDEDR